MPTSLRIAVIGAGIAGLSAALELSRSDVDVVLLEQADHVGGKVRASEVGGQLVDEGADSLLRRVPEGMALAAAAGLELTSPSPGGATIWTRGSLRPLPTGTVMGIPADLAALARSQVLSPGGLLRAARDVLQPGPWTDEDVSVGDLVTARLGREVAERLVDPLLGGVYAGRADLLSLRATLPQLAPHLTAAGSLVRAARRARGVPSPGPVFAGVAGGLGLLPAAVLSALGPRVEVRLSTTVRELQRTSDGWRLITGPTTSPTTVDVDAVVVALPAAPAARLLGAHVTTGELAGIAYASVGLVTLVLDGPSPGQGSGYLVPAVEGRTTKAVTFTSRKWGRPGPAVVRASVGRFGDERELQRDDADLVEVVRAELELAVGPLPRVLDSRVTRWGGALPQYAVGHLDVVRRLRTALPPGLAVAGAAYDGVGVPAVARSGTAAARVVLASARMAP